MTNRMRLQSIQLIQNPVDRRVRNKVIHIRRILLIMRTGRFIRKGTCARECIMRCANGFRVREGFAAEFGRETCCEVFEGAELGADVYCWQSGRGIVVEDHGEDCLGAAGVLDRLGCEE